MIVLHYMKIRERKGIKMTFALIILISRSAPQLVEERENVRLTGSQYGNVDPNYYPRVNSKFLS